MRFSRVLVEPTEASRCVQFDPDVAVVDASAADTERIASVFRDLFLGVEPDGRVFATIDNVEFEIIDEMVPLIGSRLGGRVRVIDPTIPTTLARDASMADLRAAAVRAALETLSVQPPRLDLDGIDRALTTTARRLEGPEAHEVARFEGVLSDRRRQLAGATPALPEEYARASMMLRVELATTLGPAADGDPRRIAMMSARGVANTARRWLAAVHDQKVGPIIKRQIEIHAGGVDVLGSIPAVIDLRGVQGTPPGAQALATALANHRRRVQFIVLPGDEANRDWIESVVAD